MFCTSLYCSYLWTGYKNFFYQITYDTARGMYVFILSYASKFIIINNRRKANVRFIETYKGFNTIRHTFEKAWTARIHP